MDCESGEPTVFLIRVRSKRERVLPETYWYPYNLHQHVAPERRAATLDDLVCAIYHDRSIDPRDVNDIGIGTALREWIQSRIGPHID